jgi:hypothetical protein
VAWLRGSAAQQGDLLRIGRDLVIGMRFDMRGRLIQSNAVAPNDAGLAASDVSPYVAKTVGTPKLKLKGKDSAGTVFTRVISLAA